MASTKLKIGIASLLVASVATVPILVQQRELSRIRAVHEQARQEIGQLQEKLHDTTKRMARLLDEHQRLQSELAGLRSLQNELAALKAQLKREPAKASASSISPTGSNADTGQANSQRFDQLVGYVANLRNRQFGIRAAKLTDEEKKWLDEAKPYFKELLKSPEHFAQLQSALVQGVLNLQDEAKLNSIRSVIQNSARDAAQQGLLYSADPSNESDDWKRRRFDLDRKATQEVQALLSEPERRLFDSRFLGALIMDLTPGRWDPNFEFIDPTLRGADPGSRDAVMERSPATGTLVPVAP